MWSQFLESQASQYKYDSRNCPKVERTCHIFPEPLMINHTITISLDNVLYRIELDNPSIFFWYSCDRPENRGKPKTKLHNDRNKLTHISEKDHDRRGEP